MAKTFSEKLLTFSSIYEDSNRKIRKHNFMLMAQPVELQKTDASDIAFAGILLLN